MVHPTVDEQLRGVRRLLEEAAAAPEVPAETKAALADATRQLRRLEATWPERLPALARDNVATAALLAELAALLPGPLAAEARAAAEVADPAPSDVAPAALEQRNLALRALLARAVSALPEGPAGDAVRERIATHLRARLAELAATRRRPG